MKTLLYYFVSLIGIIYFTCVPHRKHLKQDNNQLAMTGFLGDSGYITLQNLLSTLIIPADDTLYRIYKNSKPSDTLGKYYKMANGNYIASTAIVDHYENEAVAVCEATPQGIIIKKEEYSSGMYKCCWDNSYDGFQKQGDYYTFLTCGTGSAHCGGAMYAFKELKPQEEQESIIKSSWSWAGPDMQDYYISLSSKMQIKNDSIFMHYTDKLYKARKKKDKIKKLEEFDVIYVQTEGIWRATDSTKIKDYDY